MAGRKTTAEKGLEDEKYSALHSRSGWRSHRYGDNLVQDVNSTGKQFTKSNIYHSFLCACLIGNLWLIDIKADATLGFFRGLHNLTDCIKYDLELCIIFLFQFFELLRQFFV